MEDVGAGFRDHLPFLLNLYNVLTPFAFVLLYWDIMVNDIYLATASWADGDTQDWLALVPAMIASVLVVISEIWVGYLLDRDGLLVWYPCLGRLGVLSTALQLLLFVLAVAMGFNGLGAWSYGFICVAYPMSAFTGVFLRTPLRFLMQLVYLHEETSLRNILFVNDYLRYASYFFVTFILFFSACWNTTSGSNFGPALNTTAGDAADRLFYGGCIVAGSIANLCIMLLFTYNFLLPLAAVDRGTSVMGHYDSPLHPWSHKDEDDPGARRTRGCCSAYPGHIRQDSWVPWVFLLAEFFITFSIGLDFATAVELQDNFTYPFWEALAVVIVKYFLSFIMVYGLYWFVNEHRPMCTPLPPEYNPRDVRGPAFFVTVTMFICAVGLLVIGLSLVSETTEVAFVAVWMLSFTLLHGLYPMFNGRFYASMKPKTYGSFQALRSLEAPLTFASSLLYKQLIESYDLFGMLTTYFVFITIACGLVLLGFNMEAPYASYPERPLPRRRQGE